MANCKFKEDDNKAIFGVFDGHGGREVAVYCGTHYQDILNDTPVNYDENPKEWLRKSFLNVDVDLRKENG